MTYMTLDMVVIRQACGLVEDVHTTNPADHIGRIAAWARTEPERVAVLAVALACMADIAAGSTEQLIELLDATDLDIDKVLKQCHSRHERLRKLRLLGQAPQWVLVGERVYQRRRARRRRAA